MGTPAHKRGADDGGRFYGAQPIRLAKVSLGKFTFQWAPKR